MPDPRSAPSSLRCGPHAGSLLWHGSFASGASGRAASVAAQLRRCDRIRCGVCSTLRSSALLAHANAVRSAASSAAFTRCLISSATCLCPAAGLMIWPPPRLRPNDQGRPRVAARRPPSVGLARAALPGTWRRWRSCPVRSSFLLAPVPGSPHPWAGDRNESSKLPPAIDGKPFPNYHSPLPPRGDRMQGHL